MIDLHEEIHDDVPANRPRTGDWGLTVSGKQFWPQDPRIGDVLIGDIAHALAHQCRFAGHTSSFYCPAPGARVLTADLRWVPAGDLAIGDELLAFDEHPVEPGSAGKRRRRFRHGVVTFATPIRRAQIRLTMEDGTSVDASEEHPWLVATKLSRNQTWRTCRQILASIRAGNRIYMHRFTAPWQENLTRDAGWLAGIIDGEGHLSTKNRGGSILGVAQNEGLVLNEIARSLESFGFRYASRPNLGGTGKVICLQLLGGWREILRLLGTIRPIRLLDSFTRRLRAGEFDKQMDGVGAPSRIVNATEIGSRWCAGIETSRRTYICEGFGAHNSVAQHSVLVSRACPPELELIGLLHDATEAYLQDIIKPLKKALREYAELERLWAYTIGLTFGLDDKLVNLAHEVHAADRMVLIAERRDLMPPFAAWKFGRDEKAWPERIEPWSAEKARSEFRRRFWILGGFRER